MAETRRVPGVSSIETERNIVTKHEKSGVVLPFYKEESHFLDHGQFLKFVKSIESDIRRSKEYKAYISHVKKDVGLDFCMIHSDINSDIAPIEMHHTLFTLFDLVEIVMTKMFKTGEFVFSSLVSHKVLEEHFKDHVLITMLCESCHKAYHISRSKKNKNGSRFFLNIDSSFGDIVSFIEDYYDCLGFNHIGKLKMYMDEYEQVKGEANKNAPFFQEIVTHWEDKVYNRN